MNLTDREWSELAENVHLGGYEYYIHKLNQSIIEVPSEELLSLDDTLDMKEVRQTYEDKHEMFERILPMNVEDAYELMEDYVYGLPDTMLKDKLDECLKGRYPMRHFKEIIKQDNELYLNWKDYRKLKEVKWVKNQLDKIFEPEEDML